jgi:hypothetical protein
MVNGRHPWPAYLNRRAALTAEHPAANAPVVAMVGLAFEARIAAGEGVLVISRGRGCELSGALQRALRAGCRSIISFGSWRPGSRSSCGRRRDRVGRPRLRTRYERRIRSGREAWWALFRMCAMHLSSASIRPSWIPVPSCSVAAKSRLGRSLCTFRIAAAI